MSTSSVPRLAERIKSYLEELCVRIPNRHVGSPGNQRATDFFLETIASFGFQTDAPAFDCIDWEHDDVSLTVAGEAFTALVSPYSLACDVSAPLVPISTVEELAGADITGRIALLHSQLAAEQLMPKDYPFYYPDEHRRIVSLLESKQPAAVIAATGRNPGTSGAVYPFPMFEDGNFDIPSAYMTAEEGTRLLEHAGRHAGSPARLKFESRRLPSRGCNVIARKGADHSKRVQFCAHIDTKKGTPGALDNATGAAVLLALAASLKEYSGGLGLEIVAMNGEDYYAAPGELQYLALNDGKLDELQLVVNMDGAGYRDGRTAYSLYECPSDLAGAVQNHLSDSRGFVEGDPWYQGDHMVFAFNGRPAVAITSEKGLELVSEITHTAKDRPELADPEKLAILAESLRDLFLAIGGQMASS